MPEIALSGAKKDEERDLLLLLLMEIIQQSGGTFLLNSLSINAIEDYKLEYNIIEDESVLLKLTEK
jgi:hypothetical protein